MRFYELGDIRGSSYQPYAQCLFLAECAVRAAQPDGRKDAPRLHLIEKYWAAEHGKIVYRLVWPRGLATVVFGIMVANSNLPHGETIVMTAVCGILLSIIFSHHFGYAADQSALQKRAQQFRNTGIRIGNKNKCRAKIASNEEKQPYVRKKYLT